VTPSEYARLKGLFFASLDRPAGERDAFVEGSCAGDAELRGRLLALLDASHEGDGFLEERPELPAEEEEGLAAGARLGPWEIMREIGHGGMGTVYEARRAEGDFLRRTAVKVVRPEIATAFFLRRFRTERRILAGLDHPNIARLLDAGATPDGLPYVVLEFVEGEPLLTHCASRGLGLIDRLHLFRQICAAVEHAHRNLVVHRDLKPGNILVTAEGIPKLLDFGIAKLMEPETGPGPEGTATLLHLMTPDYASPEQVGNGRITTATDVYSLGVVLYELLTGQRPYRFETSDSREIARIISEQDPTKPSVRVTQAEQESSGPRDEPYSAGASAGLRSAGLAPRRAYRALRGDLDNIVMMAMRKEPERRYASVRQLSNDILRHLEGRPVVARRDTVGYRSGKFIRRHRAAVAAAALVVAALGAGFVVTVHEKRLADVQRVRAERRFNDVRKLAGSFLFEFHDAIRDLPGSTPARALVVKRGLEYLDSLVRESGGDPGLRRELAAAYQKVGDVQGDRSSANLGDTKGALRSFRKALAMREALAAQAPGNAELAGELAVTLDSVGDILSETGDRAGAFDAIRRALKVREAIVAADPKGVASRRALATSYHKIAGGFAERGEFREALPVWRKEIELFEALWRENPTDKRAQRNVALSYKYTGSTLEALGDTAGALDLYRKAVSLDEARSAADPTNAQARIDLSYSYGALSVCLGGTGDYDGALTTYRKAFAIRRALADADPKNVNAQMTVARAYLRIGEIFQMKADPVSALESYGKALAIEETLSKSDASNEVARERVAVALNHRASAEASIAAASRTPLVLRADHWREARSIYRKSLEIWQDLSRRGVLRASSAGEPDRVAQQIALCDEALKKP
jgi:serine/threonine protein kinase/tetratricopeptide (TPR) repeat protein